MTRRRSKRELFRVVEELEQEQSGSVEDLDADPLSRADKEALAELYDVDPWSDDAGDAGGDDDLEELKELADELF